MRGPWRSSSTATGRPASAADSRTVAISPARCSAVPWLALMRATSIPALTSAPTARGVAVDGPRVATILVRRMGTLEDNLQAQPDEGRRPVGEQGLEEIPRGPPVQRQ